MSRALLRRPALISIFALANLFCVCPVSAGQVEPARTGQEICYNDSGAVVACAGTGQDGDTLSGAAWPTPRFAENGDGTLTDQLTGLIWLADANCAATAGVDPNETGDGTMLWSNALQFITILNAGGYPACAAGHDDWRAPNVIELESLLNGDGDTETWLEGAGFSNLAGDGYFSSTSDPRMPYNALFVSLYTGMIGSVGKDYAVGAMWPVRGGSAGGVVDPAYPANLHRTGQVDCWDLYGADIDCAGTGQDGEVRAGVAWPEPRFSDNGDGTVTDGLTGLVWPQDANCVASQYPGLAADGGVAWQEALDFVAGINDGSYPACGAGYDDWQLPNRKQLLSLMDYSQSDPSLPAGHPFANAPNALVPSGYWGSTTYPTNTSWAWRLYHRSGQLGGAPKVPSGPYPTYGLVWPVRGVATPPPPAGDLGVSPASLDFGSVVQGGTSTPQQLTLSNAGTGPLAVSYIALTGTDAAHFALDLAGGASPCGSAAPSLDPGASCTVALTFQPTTTGAKSALVRIASDDPGEPLVDVSLAGIGMAPTGVEFPDSTLETAIREALELPSGDIAPEDLETLTTLELGGLGITDLTGLEYCTGLETLILSGNGISDLTPLADLIGLSYLNLYDNQIVDVSPLSGLFTLVYLSLGRNQIVDIGPLAGLTNLTALYLDENQIADTTALGFLTRLQDLGLSSNLIADLADLVGNNGLATGDRIWLEDNLLDLSALSAVLEDIRTLVDRGAEVFHDPVESLFGDPSLEAAVREALAMPDGILLPADLTALTELDASGRAIGDLEGVQYCVNLSGLQLQNNAIPEITQLAALTQLTSLNLSINRVDRLFPLAGLTGLTWLNLSSNSLTEITSLSALSGLTDLFLSDNAISNLAPLSGLTNLTRLALSDNLFSDLEPLVQNAGLGSGDTLWITGNATLGLRFGTDNVEHVWTLEDRGVLVHRDAITFFDTGLADAVREELELLPGQEVTRADLQGLRVLTARDGAISSLLGLELLTSLEALYLRNNQISDLTPLTNLIQLQIVDLEDNQVQDLAPLAGLVNLDQVNLAGNPLTDLSALVDNPGLGSGDLVWLRNTGLDLSPGSVAAAALWSLHQRGVIVFHEPVSGLFPDSNLEAAVAAALQTTPSLLGVGDLPNLTQLTAPERRIEDLTGIGLCTNLTELRLVGNDVADLQPLAPLSQLVILELTGNRVSDITGLGELRLDELYLGWNQIEELEPLAHSGIVLSGDRVHLEGNPLDLWVGSDDVEWMFSMHNRNVTVYHDPFHFVDPALEAVVLEVVPRVPAIVTVYTLQDMATVTELSMNDRSVFDLTGIEYFTNLRELEATDNQIDDLTPLATLPALEILDLSSNRVADLSPLQDSEIIRLYVYGNLINDVTPLANVIALERLDIHSNYLTDMEALAALPNLTVVQAEFNQIRDITLLSTSESLGMVTLLGNDLDLHVGSPTVAQLRNMDRRGVHLTYNGLSFRDPALDAAVRAALGLGPGDRMDLARLDEMAETTHLDVVDAGLADLYGIAELPALVVLDLHGNRLVDLSPLSSLVQLRNLNLDDNQIVDITPLVNNPGLGVDDRIQLRDNPLALWEGSETLAQIEQLRARGAIVHHDQVTLRVFPDANLEAAVRQALGVGPDDPLTESQLAELEALYAQEVANLEGIHHCTGLATLEILGGALEDLDPLASLTALRNLRLRGIATADWSPLAELTALEALDLTDSPFTDLRPLTGLNALARLTVSGAELEAISPLQDLANLEYLDLPGSPLMHLSPIAHMSNLQELYLTDSQDLGDISAIAGFPHLRTLDVRNSRVTDLTPLQDLLQLYWVLLSHTPVEEIAPLVANLGLGEGDAVWLDDTHLDPRVWSDDVQNILALQARGVTVHRDPIGDYDGVEEAEEQGPDGLDQNYDGNGDGIPDGGQANVASLHSQDGQHYVTIEANLPYWLEAVTAEGNPSPGDMPNGVDYPLGFFAFTIRDVPAGAPAEVRLFLEEGTTLSTYWKYGVTPDDPTPHWYEFLFDGQTGAEIEGHVITLHFVDDQRGDEALGIATIRDPGAPATRKASSGGGGGGCFLNSLDLGRH